MKTIDKEDIEYIKEIAKDMYNSTVIDPENLQPEVRQTLVWALNEQASSLVSYCNNVLNRIK